MLLLPSPSRTALGRPPRHTRRKGIETLELAVIGPMLLLVILFPSVEFGRAMMVGSLVEEAARHGARTASIALTENTDGTPGGHTTSDDDIKTQVNNFLKGAGIPEVDGTKTVVTVKVNDAVANANTAIKGDRVEVAVAVRFDEVSWLPRTINWQTYLTKNGVSITGRVSMRRE